MDVRIEKGRYWRRFGDHPRRQDGYISGLKDGTSFACFIPLIMQVIMREGNWATFYNQKRTGTKHLLGWQGRAKYWVLIFRGHCKVYACN
jgi:hypothetical protein